MFEEETRVALFNVTSEFLQLLSDDVVETSGLDVVSSAVGAVQVKEVTDLLMIHRGAIVKEPSGQQVGLAQLLASCLHREADFLDT
ncbi:Uncharacterised protein [Arcanobacterium haemolyticum]|nr:Uncharacterised protein [Arcanobacterium haemolyticum]